MLVTVGCAVQSLVYAIKYHNDVLKLRLSKSGQFATHSIMKKCANSKKSIDASNEALIYELQGVESSAMIASFVSSCVLLNPLQICLDK